MAATQQSDTLGVMGTSANTEWDWKGEYVSSLNQGIDGYERYAQLSATPDTTAMFAGPARFSGLADEGAKALLPIGLTDGIGLNQSAQLQRLYEIGSNRAFFTRGKTMNSLQFSKMLADQDNILATLTKNSKPKGLDINASGTKAAGVDAGSNAPNIWLNLDSEMTNVPFGLMLVFKSRGGHGLSGQRGKVLSAVYLEYCMLSNFSFQVSSGAPVIMENISMEFDRVVPVDIK